MRYIKIKMDVDEKNYFLVQKALKQMLEKLSEPQFYKIRSWKFIE